MSSSPEVTLTVARTGSGGRGSYVLREETDLATLKISGWRSRGQANIAGETYELEMSGVRDRGASARSPGQEESLVRISRVECVLPGAGRCEWKVKSRWRGYQATLHAENVGEINLQLGWRGRSDVIAVVHGTWSERELVVLTAAFALLGRRRDDTAASVSSAATATVAAGAAASG